MKQAYGKNVVIFDQCGVLRSGRIMEDEAYGMDIQVKMVEEMRKKLSIGKWSMLGHSYGGMLACCEKCLCRIISR